MPVNRWHVAPCGAMYKFREWDFKDITTPKVRRILLALPPTTRKALYNPDNVGRKRDLWAQRANTIILRQVMAGIVDELEKGNRVIIKQPKSNSLVFRFGYHHNPLRPLKAQAFYARRGELILDGLQHNYYFRIVGRRLRPMRKVYHTV